MTFYNVLSALLFLGALRVLLLTIDASNWSGVVAPACLAILVFNDMLATSHAVETRSEIKYSLPLMLIDLANFLLLALAMIVISPDNNLFDVSLHSLAERLRADSFWLLLAFYWLLLMWWTAICGMADWQGRRLLFWRSTVAVVLLVEWLLVVGGLNDAARIGGWVVFAYLLIYLTLIRTWLRRERRGQAAA